MATVTGLTADRMIDIENSSVTSGLVDANGELILSTRGGTPINAGQVRGTRWGQTNDVLFQPTLPNCEVEYFDGFPPEVGDSIVSHNGFGIGDVYVVISVVDDTHADLARTNLNIRGAQGSGLNAWPIGSIYITVDGQNPAVTLGGGTWERFAQGRVIVGLDEGDTDFDTVQEVGGEKEHTLTIAEMPAHDHSLRLSRETGANNATLRSGGSMETEDPGGILHQGGGGSHNNLQPFITCYIWKRIA